MENVTDIVKIALRVKIDGTLGKVGHPVFFISWGFTL